MLTNLKFFRAILFALVISAFLHPPSQAKVAGKPPRLPIEKAIAIAEEYVEKNKIDVSQSYISKVSCLYMYEELKEPVWQVEWNRIEQGKGGQIFISVHPDGKADINFGE